jgi:ADP-heptose:LPS heptosyltransferase
MPVTDSSSVKPVVRRILVVRFKAIGDVMFTQPAVAALRSAYPEAQVSFLTSALTAPLVRALPEVDKVLVLDRSRVGWNRPAQSVSTIFGLWRNLRQGSFDLAVDLHGIGESAWSLAATRAPQRWGWSVGKEHCRCYTRHESVQGRPGVVWLEGTKERHELHPADWHQEFLERCGIPLVRTRTALSLPAEAKSRADQFWRNQGWEPDQPVVFFQPFSSSGPKDWPVELQVQAARHWVARGFRAVFGGTHSEAGRLGLVREAGLAMAAGLDLLSMTALMTRCALSLGSDTGLIHLAHAAGARVLDLRRFKNAFPHWHPERAITAPGSGTVREIPFDQVLTAMSLALQEEGWLDSSLQAVRKRGSR